MYGHATWQSLSHFPISPFFNLFLFPNSTPLNLKPSHSSQHSLFSPKTRAFPRLSMDDLNDDNADAFYLVRKGDMIGIYSSLSDCRAQATSSVNDPSISVYKGYGMSKEAEEFLRSHGLKNALYSVTVDDAKDNLSAKFGALMPCHFQQPASVVAEAHDEGGDEDSPEWWEEAAKLLETAVSIALLLNDSAVQERKGFESLQTSPQVKIVKQDCSTTSVVRTQTVSSSRKSAIGSSVSMIPQTNIFGSESSINIVGTSTVSTNCDTCIIEFDGASKGNPGIAGAGVLLRAEDGSSVWRLREGVGLATNNVAEYRALLLGLRQALKKGFKRVRARGDSKLVVKQVKGEWKVKNPNMAELCSQAKKLVDKLVDFQIEHVLREYNSDADAQANRAINLSDGQVEEERL